MKATLAGLLFLVSFVLPGTGLAADARCGECRRAAEAEADRCNKAAADPAARAACNTRFGAMIRDCQAGVCIEDDPKGAGFCADCRRDAQRQAQSCTELLLGSPVRIGCTQAADSALQACEVRYCRPL
jgi:hypothetical protein